METFIRITYKNGQTESLNRYNILCETPHTFFIQYDNLIFVTIYKNEIAKFEEYHA